MWCCAVLIFVLTNVNPKTSAAVYVATAVVCAVVSNAYIVSHQRSPVGSTPSAPNAITFGRII